MVIVEAGSVRLIRLFAPRARNGVLIVSATAGAAGVPAAKDVVIVPLLTTLGAVILIVLLPLSVKPALMVVIPFVVVVFAVVVVTGPPRRFSVAFAPDEPPEFAEVKG